MRRPLRVIRSATSEKVRYDILAVDDQIVAMDIVDRVTALEIVRTVNASRPMAENVQYEYSTILLPEEVNDHARFLNRQAAEGWRFVAIDARLAYFERAKTRKDEAIDL